MPTSPSPYALALQAAQAAAGGQHYPTSCLYVLATPIGNLADISLRALCVLQMVDAIACEDTRHTATLLAQYGLHRPLLAVHQHNEAEMAQHILQRLQAGERVAYVSDAGTPAISDPGARLVQIVQTAGVRTLPLPGASSITTLVSVAGLDPGLQGTVAAGFVFLGFLPTKAQERERMVQHLSQEPRAIVLLEAPHRIHELSKALAVLDERGLTVGRELTKQFEEVATLTAQTFPAWLQATPQRSKGEFALVLHGISPHAQDEHAVPDSALRALRLLLAELPLKTAVRLAAELTGHAKNNLYAAALRMKQDQRPA
ncbi:MAG: rRNA ((1402)-2-O)-methyltransferase [Pseudomonadota bacterium]|jgi:16S rRNA (cytidine1402-2'-O)-methyltransferase